MSTAEQIGRNIVLDVQPVEGFEELSYVRFPNAAGLYDANGVRVHTDEGDPPPRVPAWRLRINPGIPAGAGFPALTPGGTPIPAPLRIPIR